VSTRIPGLAVVVTAIAIAIVGCGAQERGASRSTSTAPLGRPIGSAATSQAPGDRAALTAARAFLSSYLAITYGRAEPGRLRAATSALRAALRAQHARVPQGIRGRRPRIISLQLEPQASGRRRATATVDDGDVAPYPLFATLSRRDGRWLVVSVQG
jgi:hypothetical protein